MLIQFTVRKVQAHSILTSSYTGPNSTITIKQAYSVQPVLTTSPLRIFIASTVTAAEVFRTQDPGHYSEKVFGDSGGALGHYLETTKIAVPFCAPGAHFGLFL